MKKTTDARVVSVDTNVKSLCRVCRKVPIKIEVKDIYICAWGLIIEREIYTDIISLTVFIFHYTYYKRTVGKEPSAFFYIKNI